MSCIAMNVGLGNIWRFPFVAYENGGGAFLIPYVLVLLLMGRPMYYLEACLGQFVSRGNVKMFENLAPALKGLFLIIVARSFFLKMMRFRGGFWTISGDNMCGHLLLFFNGYYVVLFGKFIHFGSALG